MPEDEFLLAVTGKWMAHVASFLLMALEPEDLETYCCRELISHWFWQTYGKVFGSDASTAAEELHPNPKLSVVRPPALMFVRARTPKKGGRHTHREEWARQKASDAACYLAMEHLRKTRPDLSKPRAPSELADSCTSLVLPLCEHGRKSLDRFR